MATANIETKSGTKIQIEGTSQEISEIVAIVQRREGTNSSRKSASGAKEKNAGPSLTDLLLEIREEGYFDKPQGLVEVKKILEEKGHIYPVTTLSGALLTQTRKRILRRIPDGKRWVYVKGSV